MISILIHLSYSRFFSPCNGLKTDQLLALYFTTCCADDCDMLISGRKCRTSYEIWTHIISIYAECSTTWANGIEYFYPIRLYTSLVIWMFFVRLTLDCSLCTGSTILCRLRNGCSWWTVEVLRETKFQLKCDLRWRLVCSYFPLVLTHLRLVPHICVNELWNHSSDNGLAPYSRQAIIWNNARSL